VQRYLLPAAIALVIVVGIWIIFAVMAATRPPSREGEPVPSPGAAAAVASREVPPPPPDRPFVADPAWPRV
jgi:hypothetical protein